MYNITEGVYEYYKKFGMHKDITFDVLRIKLTAMVDVSAMRKRISGSGSKWKYRIGKMCIKVDHATNTIYHINTCQIPIIDEFGCSRRIRDKYVELGLNRQGNQLINH